MNNYNYDSYDWYRNMNRHNNNYISYMSTNSNSNNFDLFSPKEGFEKGNLFSNLYSEYKNYRPATLTPRNEQERKLYDLQAICFAAHELNLYLDIHPENKSMIALFNDYKDKENELTREYESKYGPLTVDSPATGETSFKWVEDKWPWEGNR